MRTVGIEALKDNAGEYVRAAASGEVVRVTDGDRVVAELGPPKRWEAMSDEEFIVAAAREGWLTPAKRRGPLPPAEGLPTIPLERLLADLARDREDT